MIRLGVSVAVGLLLASWVLLVVLARRLPPGAAKDLAAFIPDCVTTVRRLRRDPRVPRRAKLAIIAAGLWVVSPIDLVPEFLPVVGALDDIVVVALALRYAGRQVPREVLLAAWPGDPRLLERLLGRRGERSVDPVSGGEAMTGAGGRRIGPGRVAIRDVSIYAEVLGRGHPLVLMHGGPSADLWTLGAFRRCADQFTLVFYDHRCNGRSEGAPVSSLTWENLTADADALRERLGFERWAVLGHSFGGHVALEYALRYPGRLSHLVLLDTGADHRWSQNAADRLAARGYPPEKVRLVRRWFSGEFTPKEYMPIFMRIGGAYSYHPIRGTARTLMHGAWRSKMRPEALIFAGRHLVKGWTVLDRLGEISVPTLVLAGTDDFVFPPECQRELAAGIPGARLRLVERAGHNPHDEQTTEVMRAVRDFIAAG